MADNCLLLTKITFVVTQIIFKDDVINSPVAKIIFVVIWILFKVAVINSSVSKSTFVVTGTTF